MALWGLPGPEALAHAWRRPADLARVTADLGLAPGSSIAALPGYPNVRDTLGVQQLRGGGSARRAALDRLYPMLLLAAPPDAEPLPASRLEIALSADKPVYAAGDTAVFTVVTTRDCYLTLIGIDRHGRATVLLPSELEPANRIAAGRPVRVPGDSAAYRFRFKEKGRETIVAICSETHKSPEGVYHDYDRLRFTVLGDWQLFLREPPAIKEVMQARRDDAATDIPRPSVRRRRAADPKAGVPAGPDVHTRTAITVEIE